jgi:disulfide bond formation protein DsbB
VPDHNLVTGVSNVLAACAIGLEIIVGLMVVLMLVSLVSKTARGWLLEARELLFGYELWVAWALAAIATGGSLFFSEYANFIPCELCWFQRINMYPLSVILLVAALRRDRRAGPLYACVFPFVGAGIAAFHIYVENNPSAEPSGCKLGASCATKWINQFGYVTIPTLSLTAFLAIELLLFCAWSRRNVAETAS